MSDGISTSRGETNTPTSPRDSGAREMGDAVKMLTDRWKDDESPSDASAKGAKADREDETDPDQSVDGTEIEADDSDKTDHDDDATDATDGDDADKDATAAKSTASDDSEVEIKVDGEVRRVSVKDLKRLYGQEATITRKSQEAAASRKVAEDKAEHHAASLTKLMERAQARLKPYQDIDFLVASKMMEAEEFAKLRQDAKAAYDEVKSLEGEVDTFIKTASNERQQALQAAAVEANKVLPTKIKGWNQETYDKIRTYAVKEGLSHDVVNSIADPSAIVLLNKARLYDEMKARAATVKKDVVAKPAKNAVKSTKAPGSTVAHTEKKALSKASQTGKLEDGAAVLMARWG